MTRAVPRDTPAFMVNVGSSSPPWPPACYLNILTGRKYASPSALQHAAATNVQRRRRGCMARRLVARLNKQDGARRRAGHATRPGVGVMAAGFLAARRRAAKIQPRVARVDGALASSVDVPLTLHGAARRVRAASPGLLPWREVLEKLALFCRGSRRAAFTALLLSVGVGLAVGAAPHLLVLAARVVFADTSGSVLVDQARIIHCLLPPAKYGRRKCLGLGSFH